MFYLNCRVFIDKSWHCPDILVGKQIVCFGALPRQSPVPYSHKNLRLRSHIPAKIRAVVYGDVSSLVNEDSGKFQEVADKVIHLYCIPFLQDSATAELLKLVQTKISNQIIGLKTEQCFNIGLSSDLSRDKLSVLNWVLGETYEAESLGSESFLEGEKRKSVDAYIIEVGPRLSFTTAWSANAVSICQACGLTEIKRMERSRRYLLYVNGSLLDSQINAFASMVHDRMTECVYVEEISSHLWLCWVGFQGLNPSQPRLVHNESVRSECLFTSVILEESPSIMFKAMEGSTLGVWAAHGEGRAYFPEDSIFKHILHSNLAPVKYCNDDGRPTDV